MGDFARARLIVLALSPCLLKGFPLFLVEYVVASHWRYLTGAAPLGCHNLSIRTYYLVVIGSGGLFDNSYGTIARDEVWWPRRFSKMLQQVVCCDSSLGWTSWDTIGVGSQYVFIGM